MSIKFCLRPSLPEGLLFVSKVIDFMISSKDIKVFVRYFLSVRNFANKFSISSCGSSLGVEFHKFFCRFKNVLRIARIF